MELLKPSEVPPCEASIRRGASVQFVVYRMLKKEKEQDGAAADSDGLKELLKERHFGHLLFNATLAICSVRSGCQRRQRRADGPVCKIDPLPHKFPAAIKSQRRNGTNSVLWRVRSRCQKQQFMLFPCSDI